MRLSLIMRGVVANFVLTPMATVLFLRACHVQPLVAAGF
jgi:predicted Na+-dependent transporter